MNGRPQMQRKKLDFVERDQCKLVLLSLAENLEKPLMSHYGLWDRMEGASMAMSRYRYDMNGRSQMQGGKNWILSKEINANWFF